METAEACPKGSPFAGPDAPREEELYRCVHCGLCLNACPTYLETGLETESPRGRIALMKAVSEGRIGITDSVAQHWNLCLQCRACEAVCPSGVPYGRLMEHTRTRMAARRRPGPLTWLLRRLAFHHLLPHQGRLMYLARLLRLYQHSGLRRPVRFTRLLRLLPGGLASLEALLPEVPDRFFGPTSTIYPAQGECRGWVAVLSGCVMPLLHGSTMEATIRVLTRNGYDVAVPVGQACCGALNVHAGERKGAKRMARRNIEALLASRPDAIIVNSAGCGSAMKEYGELLHDDPQYGERAEHFSSLVKDVHEFVAELPFERGLGEVRARVTYQDPCHLAHAQRITQAPRELLRAIPGVELVEMEEASVCCGAAGSYAATQRRFSQRLLERKVGNVAETGADIVATANPGCALQLEMGLRQAGLPGRVCYVMDLLDEAYRRGEEVEQLEEEQGD